MEGKKMACGIQTIKWSVYNSVQPKKKRKYTNTHSESRAFFQGKTAGEKQKIFRKIYRLTRRCKSSTDIHREITMNYEVAH